MGKFKRTIKKYRPVFKFVSALFVFSAIIYAIWKQAGWSFQSKFPWFYILGGLSLLGLSAVFFLFLYILDEIAFDLYNKLFSFIKNKTLRVWFVRFLFFFIIVVIGKLMER